MADGWFILYDMQHSLLILKHTSPTANTFILHYEGIRAPIIFGRCPCQRTRVSLYYELISSAERNERERNKQTTRGRNTQNINYSDSVTSTSELLLRQNSVTAQARRLASDHCATEIHRTKICRSTFIECDSNLTAPACVDCLIWAWREIGMWGIGRVDRGSRHAMSKIGLPS
jgi:hypothetical protein